MDLRKLCKRTTYKRVQRQQKGGFFKFGELRERSVLLNNKNDRKNIVFFFFITSLSHRGCTIFHCDIILRFFYFSITEGYLEDGGHD